MSEDLKPKKGVLIEGYITPKYHLEISINKKYKLMQDDIDYIIIRNYKPNGKLIEAYLTRCTEGNKKTLKAKLKSVNI